MARTTIDGGGWGRALRWPLAAAILGLAVGYALGRFQRPAAPTADEAAAAVADRPLLPSALPGASANVRADVRAPSVLDKARPMAVDPAPVNSGNAARGPSATAFINSAPAGATVTRTSDGEVLGTTPFELDLPRSREPIALLFSKKGYTSVEDLLVPEGAARLDVNLVLAPAPTRAAKRKTLSPTTTIDPF